jgi:hypothetical protein
LHGITAELQPIATHPCAAWSSEPRSLRRVALGVAVVDSLAVFVADAVSGAGVLNGAAAGMQSGLIAGVVPQHHHRWRQDDSERAEDQRMGWSEGDLERDQ